MGALFGLLTSLAIGLTDFFGRPVVRRSSALTAGVTVQFIAIFSAAASLLLVDSEPRLVDLGYGALSGVGMAAGLGCYFEGINRSSATMVAPLVATLSALVPFAYTVLAGATTSERAIFGAVIAAAGLALVSLGLDITEEDRAAAGQGLRWGLASGIGYGFALTVVIAASEEAGAWPAVTQRVAALAVIAALALRLDLDLAPPVEVRTGALIAGVMAGLSGVFYVIGLMFDPGTTAVTAAMFPAMSVAVGRLFFGDQASARQGVGVGLSILGVIFVVS